MCIVQGDLLFYVFQESCHPDHLGYDIVINTAVLNPQCGLVTQKIIHFNLTWFGRCHYMNFKMAAIATVIDLVRNDFSNS